MTPDYRSQTTYILIDGMQAYRNLGPGLLITNSENVVVDGCTFSDNRGNIDVHRSETILINNTSIVGMSRELQLLEATQIGLSSVLCPNQQTYLSAVEMNSFTRSRQGTGLSLKNLDISGFSDIEKCEEYVISVDAQVGLKIVHSMMFNLQKVNFISPLFFSLVRELSISSPSSQAYELRTAPRALTFVRAFETLSETFTLSTRTAA
jgi:parallel beta-helix repeat protein